MITKYLKIWALGSIVWSSAAAFAVDTGFLLEKLPKGAELTLPQPATVLVSPRTRVMVSSTDSPQTLRITAVNVEGASSASVRVSIFDSHQGRVRYVDLKPGTPFLYNFQRLSSIYVVSEQQGSFGTRIQLESDKPLTIKH